MADDTDPLAQAIEEHGDADIPVEEQQELGKPQAASFSDEHDHFLATVLQLIDEGKINTGVPESFINQDIYDGLSEELQGKVDLAIPNVVSFLDKIIELHKRPESNESYEMKTLIESLWQTKQRIEEQADVFIF
jgi:hypothetical protein